jgi:hypothetical protein
MPLNALFGLAFAAAAQEDLLNLAAQINSPAHSSIGTPSSFRRRTLTVCRHTVSDLFHSPPGVLFTFPSRYLFTIGRREYLALGCGHPCFPQDFPCPVVLKVIARSLSSFAYRTITLYGSPFQVPSAKVEVSHSLRGLGPSLAMPCNPPMT